EVEKSDHYALLHKLKGSKSEAASRLKRLEANYRAFYYWFALQGKVLPVPDQRLIAVLVTQADEYKRHQQIFDTRPTVPDGFLARRDNLAIFSLERTDLASQAMDKNTKALWRDLRTDPEASLKDWPKTNEGRKLDLAAGAEVQTLALLERA